MQNYKISILFLIAVIALLGELRGQDTVYVDSTRAMGDTIVLHNEDESHRPYIKSVRLRSLRSKHPEPIASIFSGSKLKLSFDDLSDRYIEYRVEFEECDKDWIPMGTDRMEFFESAQDFTINDYQFSSATKIGYVHYNFTFPRDAERFIRSGNFLLHVRDVDKDSIVLTKRFMIVDPNISISANVVRTDDVRQSDYRQQVQMMIRDHKSMLEDVGRIYVRVMKNASWDITCDNLKPSFVNGNEIVFQRSDACTFEGGNEYRFVNFLQYRLLSMNIVRVNIENSGMYEMWIETDKARSFLRYSSLDDHNGMILHGSDQRSFEANQLDYARIHFSLNPGDIMFGHEIYLYGELSNFRLNEKFKMEYNPESEKYELSLELKQGLYSYQYVVKSIYDNVPDEGMIEGTHFETENDYTILVYYSDPFEGYDRLLGIERINSRVGLDE